MEASFKVLISSKGSRVFLAWNGILGRWTDTVPATQSALQLQCCCEALSSAFWAGFSRVKKKRRVTLRGRYCMLVAAQHGTQSNLSALATTQSFNTSCPQTNQRERLCDGVQYCLNSHCNQPLAGRFTTGHIACDRDDDFEHLASLLKMRLILRLVGSHPSAFLVFQACGEPFRLLLVANVVVETHHVIEDLCLQSQALDLPSI